MNESSSIVFTWHEGFLLGYAPMDRVHEEFVMLIRAVIDAPHRAVRGALDALAGHARQHFDDEDRWMAETAFPARQCHSDEHAAVLRSIEGVCKRVAHGDCEAARRLAQALVDWFPGHADYLDAALAHWMCNLQLGGKPVVLRRHIEHSARPLPADITSHSPRIEC